MTVSPEADELSCLKTENKTGFPFLVLKPASSARIAINRSAYNPQEREGRQGRWDGGTLRRATQNAAHDWRAILTRLREGNRVIITKQLPVLIQVNPSGPVWCRLLQLDRETVRWLSGRRLKVLYLVPRGLYV